MCYCISPNTHKVFTVWCYSTVQAALETSEADNRCVMHFMCLGAAQKCYCVQSSKAWKVCIALLDLHWLE